VTNKRRDFYTKQLNEINEKLAAVESDLESTTESEKWRSLKNRAEQLLTEYEEVDAKLAELDSKNPSQNIRDRTLEKTLQKINFTDAKRTANLIRDRLNRDGGSVLFLLQKSKRQMGHYCVEEVINVIMSEQIVDGQIIGSYRRYSVDLGSAISQYNETEFLIRLASHFNIDSSAALEEVSQRIRKKIRSSIGDGTTIFLEIKSLDDLLEQEEFLEWFIKEFWKPLIDEITVVSKIYRSKFIVALIADSQILLDRSPDYFCDNDSFDRYKMLELPLPNWTVEDIEDWLIRFRVLLASMEGKTDAEFRQVARKIHRGSEGIPESVDVSLRGMFV
jgi:hypothetical protein